MANNFTGLCPDCATTLLLLALDDPNCDTYKLYLSEIKSLIITPNGAPTPFDWSLYATTGAVSLVAGAIDNTNIDNLKSKIVRVIGSMPAPTEVTIPGPDQTTLVVNRTYAPTFQVVNMSAANRKFVKQFQCNWTGFTFHVITLGGQLFGNGNGGGIIPKRTTAALPLNSGNNAVEAGTINITFDSLIDPDRADSPL